MQNGGSFSAVPDFQLAPTKGTLIIQFPLSSYAPVLARCGHDLPVLLQVPGDKASEITAASTLTGSIDVSPTVLCQLGRRYQTLKALEDAHDPQSVKRPARLLQKPALRTVGWLTSDGEQDVKNA
ncbi:hypothetical protein RJZ56_003521 [Blastomyces dermatitidis]|uniref:Uncharacterized protein n=1 Tax=Ajellomyces dermatitidis (strain ER-3 / ATCC MYA-2586) TaxID=559297 RepID=A0ABP2ELA1_AJEDR|nr:uncharacterized protein BDCG_00816 [Blastomyces dermatitidis ER-3]EEQ84011.1 hypothetical protein BDCG_00816 [Blastomyces dermatitidis ER-3]